MRPLLFVLGLAFVACVLSADESDDEGADEIQCYWHIEDKYKPYFCSGKICYTKVGEYARRGCLPTDGSCYREDYHCCSTDYCNGFETCTLHVPLIIAAVAISIAVVIAAIASAVAIIARRHSPSHSHAPSPAIEL
ncbi:hypothetical protein AAVH_28269 [Aphelenchoides avenae]|nr:hypothetical protein AAVH_28269 [Aphelenchus avenae]